MEKAVLDRLHNEYRQLSITYLATAACMTSEGSSEFNTRIRQIQDNIDEIEHHITREERVRANWEFIDSKLA